VISKLKGKRRAFRKLDRESRRLLIRGVFEAHRANRELWNYVQWGR